MLGEAKATPCRESFCLSFLTFFCHAFPAVKVSSAASLPAASIRISELRSIRLCRYDLCRREGFGHAL